MTTETDELNYDDYTHDFMGKVGNVQDFSRDFLVGLARVFEDVLNFMPYAHVKTYSEKVGISAAMDVAAELSRAGMRQVMPMGRYIAPPGWDWKNFLGANSTSTCRQRISSLPKENPSACGRTRAVKKTIRLPRPPLIRGPAR